MRLRGANPAAFAAYADRRWGVGWRRNPGGRRSAIGAVLVCNADTLAKLLADDTRERA